MQPTWPLAIERDGTRYVLSTMEHAIDDDPYAWYAAYVSDAGEWWFPMVKK